jgi:hypothetical protein
VGRDDTILLLEHAFPGNFPGIKIIPATETETKSIQHSLKSKNSSGYVGITKFWKLVQFLISHPLTQLCIYSLLMSIFRDCLKILITNPLNKKRGGRGNKTIMMTYRTVSLLTAFSKEPENVTQHA